MTYVVLYNADENILGGDEKDALAVKGNREAKDAIVEALRPLGRVEILETGDGDPERLGRELRQLAPKAVFNLAEAVRGVSSLEPSIPALLDLLGIPYTGSGPLTLALCLDKPRTKTLLSGAGLPTPGWMVLDDPFRDPLDGLHPPLIVKPAAMDASHGIGVDSVVTTDNAARQRALLLKRQYGCAALVEEFIDGRELYATIAGDPPALLPVSEVAWALPEATPRIVSYDAKWLEDTPDYEGTPVNCPADLDADLESEVAKISLSAFKLVGARDYARIDLRVDRSGRPFILEVNPNPDIGPHAGVAKAVRVSGRTYDDFMRELIRRAEARAPRDPRPSARRS